MGLVPAAEGDADETEGDDGCGAAPRCAKQPCRPQRGPPVHHITI